MFMCYGWGAPFVAWNDDKFEYIRIASDGTINMSTVSPHRIEVIEKPVELRRAMRKVSIIAKVGLGYHKLKESTAAGRDFPSTWLLNQYKKPIEELDLSSLFLNDRVDAKQQMKEGIESVRWAIARWEGFMGTREVLYG
jgi:hypothetical protein